MFRILLAVLLLWGYGIAHAEEEDDGVVAQVVDADDLGDELEDDDDAVDDDRVDERRLLRLSEASGRPVDEIRAMRLAGGEDGESKRGWGVIAQELGLHPGVLGHGTGDKFFPEDQGVSDGDGAADEPLDLDLPDLDSESQDAVRTARERAMERNTVRKQVRAEAKAERAEAKAVRDRDRDAWRNARDQRDKNNPSADRDARDRGGPPDEANRGNGNGSKKGQGRGN